jgi:hypothetical protein
MAEFQFLLHNGSFVTYDDWEDVPEDLQFRNVIKFIPDYPEEPHTEDEHAVMAVWNDRLQELLERERASSN